MIAHWRDQRWSELCRNKCRFLDVGGGPLRRAPGRQSSLHVFEVDIQNHVPQYIRSLPRTKQYPTYGLDESGFTQAEFCKFTDLSNCLKLLTESHI
jgi:hypothetical protein